MELQNDFQVDIPIDKIWEVFNDVERIAPCLPGAQLQEMDGDKFTGIVKVKVGPITTQYKGVASFLEQDEAAHKVVIKAEGRDTKGAGNASATITVQLEGDAAQTKVSVNTDLSVTGKVAQFGRGVMGDISSKLMEQFAENLRELLDSPDGAPEPAPKSETSETEANPNPNPEPEAVDILSISSSRMVRIGGKIIGFFWAIGRAIKGPFVRKPKSTP